MEQLADQRPLDAVCRVCMLTSSTLKFHSLLEEPLISRFRECTSIQICTADNISTQLCSLCVARCEAAKYFRDKAAESDKKLRLLRKNERVYQDYDYVVHEIDAEEDLQANQIKSVRAMDELTVFNEIPPEEEDDDFEEREVVQCEEFDIAFDVVEENHTGPVPVHSVNISEAQQLQQKNSPVACQFCESEFRYRSTLASHYQSEHPNELFLCELCNKSYSSVLSWRSHKCTATMGSFCCPTCGKNFTHRGSLRMHMKIHSNERHTCELCQKQFVLLANYKTHMKRHSKGRSFQCDECPKAFKEKRELVRHRRLVHIKEHDFQCSQCSRSFALKYMLIRHNQVHTGERPYPCSVCNLSLSSQGALKHHMYTHTGDKPYGCELCPATFRIKFHLTRHLGKEHPTF